MTSLLFLGGLFLGASAEATPTGGDKFLSYQENYRKSPHWYEFTIDSHCKENKEPISIQEFTSEKKYEGKSVRIVHIYANVYNQDCKDPVNEKKIRKVVIPIDNKRMTHVYVTYSSQLSVTSGH